MKKKRLLIIINPKAGKMKAKKSLRNVIDIFEDAGYLVSVSPTRRRFHATGITKRKARKYDLLVCCGGDGTLNEVLSGLVTLEKPPKLGYIPCGSTNDFAAGLKLPKNILEAAKKIVSGKLSPIDVGMFNGRVFSYVASFGAFTEVSYATPQEMKNLWGHMAYLFSGIKDIKNIKPQHVKVTANGKVYEDDYLFGAVANAVSIAGIIKLDPKIAKLDDGLFEVILVKHPKNILELNRIVSCFLRRRFEDNLITFIQASELKIEASPDMHWSLDGEYEKGSPEITIENLNKAIKILH